MPNHKIAEEFNSTEVATALCAKNGWSGVAMVWALEAAIDFQARRLPELELMEIGEGLTKCYLDYKSQKGKYAVGPQKFFEQGHYQEHSGGLPRSPAEVLKDNPATRALAQMEAD